MEFRDFVFTVRLLVIIGDKHVNIFYTKSCGSCKGMLEILKIKRKVYWKFFPFSQGKIY